MAEPKRKIVPVDTTYPRWQDFAASLEQRTYLDGAIKELEEQKKGLDGELLAIASGWALELGGRGDDGVLTKVTFVAQLDGVPYQLGVYQNRGRREIKPELLLQQGMTVEQIERATVEGDPGKAYIRVAKGKEEAVDA